MSEVGAAGATVLTALTTLDKLGDRLRDDWAPLTLATGLIVVGAWLVDRALARRVSAAWRVLPYVAVLARLLLPAGWHSPLGLFPGRGGPPPVAPGEPVFVLLDATPLVVAQAPGPGVWLALAYAAGVLALLARFVVTRLRLRRQLRASTLLPLQVEGTPVWRHPTLGPCVAGLWRPRIVLPAALVDGSPEDQREAQDWILRHELAHIRRRDPLLTALVQLICCLAWPVLPLWIAARRIRTLMEEACDERAVAGASPASRRRYGELLLALAEDRMPARFAQVLGFPALGSPLRSRLRALGSQRRWPVALQGLAAVVLGAVALACGGESGDDVDAPFDAGDASASALRLDPALVGPLAGPALGNGLSVPGYTPLGRFGVKPATANRQVPRLLESKLALAPELKVMPAPAAPAASSASETRARRLRQTAPTVRIFQDGTWLCTARGGCSRMGGAKPLDTALREALAQTGSRAVLVDAFGSVPHERVAEVLAAAKRAGAEELAASVVPFGDPRQSAPQVPSLVPGAAKVSSSGGGPILSVTASGDLYLWNERVTPEQLEDQLRRWLTHSPSRTLLIRGDKQAMNRSAVDIMAIAKRAGIQNIGILSGPPEPPVPAAARGSLDKEIIDRVVRDHMQEVRACYEAQLRHDRKLGGAIRVMFTIGATGSVVASELEKSTMNNRLVNDCLVQAVRAWTFPPPEGGGVVVVNYPFVFASSSRGE
jgi:TonB family protein